MGWAEFLGWLEVVKRQRETKRPDPGSWEGHESDPDWAEMRRQRDALRG